MYFNKDIFEDAREALTLVPHVSKDFTEQEFEEEVCRTFTEEGMRFCLKNQGSGIVKQIFPWPRLVNQRVYSCIDILRDSSLECLIHHQGQRSSKNAGLGNRAPTPRGSSQKLCVLYNELGRQTLVNK